MKYIRYFLVLLLFLLILINTGMSVFAMNTGFSTEPITRNDAKHFLQSTNISVFKNEPKEKTIEYFDVNENGLVALVFSGFLEKTIGIYTSEGVFQYGYKCNSYGSVAVEWDGDNLILCFVRSDIAVSVNPEGEVESIRRIQNTIENNSYWNHSVYLKKRNIEGTEYTLKNDMGVLNAIAMNYSQLAVTKADGSITVIYDANSKHLLRASTLTAAVVFMICLAVIVLIRLFIRTRREYLMSINNKRYNQYDSGYTNDNTWDNNGNKGTENGSE